MNFFTAVKNSVIRGMNALSGKFDGLFRRPKKSFPLAERLLADALRLGEIPSPTEREEERALFIAERLDSLSIPYTVDGDGNILVWLHGTGSGDPLLLFTGLGSSRWTPLESLGKIGLQQASGAGLADALGPAALLSVAETHAPEPSARDRDILLFFSVFDFDDPSTDSFLPLADLERRPFAALGIRGFSLGSLYNPLMGSCRLEIKFTAALPENGEMLSARCTGALVEMASRYAAAGETDADPRIDIRRIEALALYGRLPAEGALELVLESAHRERLESAVETIKLHAASYAAPGLSCSTRLVSSIPPSDPALCSALSRTLQNAMKELKITPVEHSFSDPASFLSNMGIPALSFGLAGGREGLDHDTVEIASIETGRLLLEKCIALLTREESIETAPAT